MCVHVYVCLEHAHIRCPLFPIFETARVGVTGAWPHPAFYIRAEDPNSGPHGHTASVLTHGAIFPYWEFTLLTKPTLVE